MLVAMLMQDLYMRSLTFKRDGTDVLVSRTCVSAHCSNTHFHIHNYIYIYIYIYIMHHYTNLLIHIRASIIRTHYSSVLSEVFLRVLLLTLEKVLDPIFMILKCEIVHSLWIVFFETSQRFDFSTRSLGHIHNYIYIYIYIFITQTYSFILEHPSFALITPSVLSEVFLRVLLLTLEKVLLNPIFTILKCELFTHFGSCFLKLHDVSTSQLEVLVT